MHVPLLLTPGAPPSRLSTCRPPYLPPLTLTCHHPPSSCPQLSPFAHLPPSCLSAHPLRPLALFVAWPLTCDHRRGPRLHVHLPSPAPPSRLAPHHSHDMVVTDHPRYAIVAEAAPRQPPVTRPCAHHHHPWGGMAVGQDGEGGRGGEDVHMYVLAPRSPSCPDLSGSRSSPSPSMHNRCHHATATHRPPVPTAQDRA